jgi:hypothetical protein
MGMLDIPGHGATEIKIEHLPFYRSLQVVSEKTGLDQSIVLRNQVGFKASPAACLCNYEWNAFDAVIETVNQGPHDWPFFAKILSGTITKFFYRTLDLNCPNCGVLSKQVGIRYAYPVENPWKRHR